MLNWDTYMDLTKKQILVSDSLVWTFVAGITCIMPEWFLFLLSALVCGEGAMSKLPFFGWGKLNISIHNVFFKKTIIVFYIRKK